MMELTDRHFRFLARQLTRHAVLYTEMLTSRAVIHGDRQYLLGFDPGESPVILQLGGADPAEMADAARIGEQWGYDGINMNVGCPSDRVLSGRFGACLMAEADLVGECIAAMQARVQIPVTVKCRLGIDRNDSYEALAEFVDRVASAGCRHFDVHARKAWLDGLSPKENRTIPPLRYEYVYRLKSERPHLTIVINGGIEDWTAIREHWRHVDGVMLGRKAYYDPAILLQVDAELSRINSAQSVDQPVTPNATDSIDRLAAAARAYARYMQGLLADGVRVSALSRHAVALFQGVPGARLWRRHLSEAATGCDDAIALVEAALVPVLSRNLEAER